MIRGTPPIDGGGGGEADLSFRAVVANDETPMSVGHLIYIDDEGRARKASASNITTADVAGMVISRQLLPAIFARLHVTRSKRSLTSADLVDGGPALA